MDCEIPAWNNRTFGVLWQDIVRIADKRPTKAYGSIGNLNWLEANIEEFSTKLGAFLPDLEKRTNELLASFVPWTAVALKLERRPAYNSRVKRMKFTTGVVSLKVTYRGRPLAKLDGFLNEARITAIALSLFLAALTLSTPPRTSSPGGDVYFPRLLVLDDVLISLDMAHRRPLLNVLMQHFKDWQVFLLTHDREWYEIAKNILPNGEWRFAEIHSVPWGEHEQPLIKGDVPHLQRAREFLRQGEIKAAAVHVRTQFELVLKEACRELSLKVVYVDDPKRWDANHFWDTVKAHWKLRPEMSKLVADVSHSLSWVLNPHSHSRPVTQIRREIQEALEAVASLEAAVTGEIASRKLTMAANAKAAAEAKNSQVKTEGPEWVI